jgi:hypothetical protein
MGNPRSEARYWKVALGALLVIALLTTLTIDIARRRRASTAFHAGTKFIAQMLLNMREHRDGSVEQSYLIDTYERALTELARLDSSQLSEPVPVAAFFRMNERPGGLTPSLNVEWCESGFDATGIYVIDDTGAQYDFRNVTWQDDWYRKVYSNTVYRSCGFAIAIDDATAAAWSAFEHPWRTLQLNRKVLKGPVQVGLLKKDGTRTPPIAACLPERLINSD